MSKTTNDIATVKLHISIIEDKIKSLKETFNSYLEKVSEVSSENETMETSIKEVFVTESCELYDKVTNIHQNVHYIFEEIRDTIRHFNEDVSCLLVADYYDNY